MTRSPLDQTAAPSTVAPTSTDLRQQVRDALVRSTVFVERAVLALYDRQTSDEQSSQATREDNGVGFNGVDAPLLSSFAEQIKRKANWRNPVIPEGQRLTEKQVAIARRKLLRYTRQLAEVASARRPS